MGNKRIDSNITFAGTSLAAIALAPLAGPAMVNMMAGTAVAAAVPVLGTTLGTLATGGLIASGVAGTTFAASNIAEAETGYNLAKEIMFQGDDKTYREHNQIVNSINVNTIITGGVQLAQDIAQQAQQSAISKASVEQSSDKKLAKPDDFLDEALTQQGLKNPTARLKHKWTDGEYKYEVRIHEGENQYTDSNSIYRVSRQQIPISGTKGTGHEYLGTDGNWYHTSVLRPTNRIGEPNLLYDENAAKITHIPLQKGE